MALWGVCKFLAFVTGSYHGPDNTSATTSLLLSRNYQVLCSAPPLKAQNLTPKQRENRMAPSRCAQSTARCVHLVYPVPTQISCHLSHPVLSTICLPRH